MSVAERLAELEAETRRLKATSCAVCAHVFGEHYGTFASIQPSTKCSHTKYEAHDGGYSGIVCRCKRFVDPSEVLDVSGLSETREETEEGKR